jgi:acetylornithine/succinyldiaminopimelate/putrescine aminotransferase
LHEHLSARGEKLLGGRKIGAILVEPVQGRGGEVVPPDWFLPHAPLAGDQFGALLIFDEIYTGFHRTGRRFACDHWKARPI